MATLKELQSFGEELKKLLFLRTSPLAVGVIRKEEDLPEGAIRPMRDLGAHLALCQAFAMSRREKATIVMTKEDHWCWAPIIAFGLVEPPAFFLEGKTAHPFMVADLDAAKELAGTEPRLPHTEYVAIASAPLESTGFEPDVVLIYGNASQMRTLLLAVKYHDGQRVTSTFDPLDSCVHTVVSAMLTGEYKMAFPDPGEYQRALATEDEIIFAVPKEKLAGIILGLRHIEETHHGYTAFNQTMRTDFPQPAFYKELFKIMGL